MPCKQTTVLPLIITYVIVANFDQNKINAQALYSVNTRIFSVRTLRHVMHIARDYDQCATALGRGHATSRMQHLKNIMY